MNRKYDLQNLIAALLSGRKMSLDTVVARAELNFEWISQTLQFNAETIYRFRVDNNRENICVFLSEPLLKHQGTLIYSYTTISRLLLFPLSRSQTQIPNIRKSTGQCAHATSMRFRRRSTLPQASLWMRLRL